MYSNTLRYIMHTYTVIYNNQVTKCTQFVIYTFIIISIYNTLLHDSNLNIIKNA